MTTIDRIREALEDLAHRSPVVVIRRRRQRDRERLAFRYGAEWGMFNTAPHHAEKVA